MPRMENARVKSLRTKVSPRSESSFSARTKTGTTSEVSTAPSTISVTRLGIWLALLKAVPTVAPRVAPISICRRKPVMRESSVAMAIVPVARMTS